MNRKVMNLLAAGAVLGAASAANAAVVDGLDTVQPVINTNEEVFGPDTVITFDVPAGAAPNLTDTSNLNAFLRGLDSGGTNITGNLSLTVVGGPVAYNDGAGNANVQVDIGASGIPAAVLNTAGVTSWQLVVTTDADPLTNAVQTQFDAANEANDECFALDNTAPELSDAFLSTDGNTLFLVYSEAMSISNDGTGPNSDNQTIVGNVTNADFQLNSTNTFDNATGNPPLTFTVSGTFLDANFTTLQIDVTGNASVVPGAFIRTAADDDGNPVAANDLFDVVGNQAFQQDASGNAVTTGVEIRTVETLTINSIDAIDTITGVVAGQDTLRVTYNLPLDAADLGDVAFYNSILQNSAATDIIVSAGGVTADPMDANSVLLALDGGGTDLILADGRDENGDTYTLTTDVMQNVPSSLFGTNDYQTSAQTLTVGDAILPTLQFVSFHDLDGDGEQDAVAAVYDEPMADYTVTDGLTVAGLTGVTVNPFSQIDPATFALVTDTTGNTANISITGVLRTSIDTTNDGTTTAQETNNAIVAQFDPQAYDWDGDMTTAVGGDTEEAIPGTGDAGAQTLAYDAMTGSVVDDRGGNAAATFTATATSRDRAAPVNVAGVFYTGDNQGAGSNDQLFDEQDALTTGNVGDQTANNRLAIFVSEDFAGTPNAGNTTEESIVFGPDSTTFQNTDLLFSNVNSITLGFNASPASTDLAVGNEFSIISGSQLEDTALGADVNGNEVLISGATITNGVALYTPLTIGVDGTTVTHSAFLIDTDGDNFADEIRVTMTQPVDATTLDTTDFTVTGFTGLVTGVAIDGTDARVIVISLEDGRASINSTLTVQYNGASDSSLINSDTTLGGTGIPVSDSNATFNAEDVIQPSADTQNVAIMPVVGSITIGGQPAPRGTKIFALNAVPTAYRVTAEHNGVSFSVTDSSSREAFTNFLFGLESFVYLTRNNSNVQEYRNDKFGGLVGADTFEDVIGLNINARNLTSISFQGNGETSDDEVRNGSVALCWDVLRSADGTVASLYNAGFDVGGTPIASSAVITSDDGSYSMHISAPAAVFNGRSVLGSIGRPIIMVIETPDGSRFACSSLLTSADTANLDGGPFLFNPTNRTQDNDGEALDAARFDVDLDNVGTQIVFPGWNLEGFPRVGGWAQSSGNRPELPSGIVEDNIFVGTNLPNVGALDQFVLFNDGNNDGAWTLGDDGGNLLSSIVIDANCFPHFAFTMTSFGVQLNANINNLVGGYGFGFFNNTTSDYGIFQFGTPLTATSIFPAGEFPNSSSTQGWYLGTATTGFNPATGFFTNNTDADYLITFENSGGGNIEVTSLSETPGGANPNDASSVSAGQAIFVHIED